MPAPQPSLPGDISVPGSPAISSKMHHSVSNLQDISHQHLGSSASLYKPSTLPIITQNVPLDIGQARVQPSFSTSDVAALASNVSDAAAPGSRDGQQVPTTPTMKQRASSVVFDSMEPKMFPGVVTSQRRKGSIARSGSLNLGEAVSPGGTAHRRGLSESGRTNDEDV